MPCLGPSEGVQGKAGGGLPSLAGTEDMALPRMSTLGELGRGEAHQEIAGSPSRPAREDVARPEKAQCSQRGQSADRGWCPRASQGGEGGGGWGKFKVLLNWQDEMFCPQVELGAGKQVHSQYT